VEKGIIYTNSDALATQAVCGYGEVPRHCAWLINLRCAWLTNCALCLVNEYVHTFSLQAGYILTHVHHAIDQWRHMINVRHMCCVPSVIVCWLPWWSWVRKTGNINWLIDWLSHWEPPSGSYLTRRTLSFKQSWSLLTKLATTITLANSTMHAPQVSVPYISIHASAFMDTRWTSVLLLLHTA